MVEAGRWECHVLFRSSTVSHDDAHQGQDADGQGYVALLTQKLSSISMLPTKYVLFLTQITRIKERVEEKEGIPPAQQRLIFGGKQMYVALLTQERRKDGQGLRY